MDRQAGLQGLTSLPDTQLGRLGWDGLPSLYRASISCANHHKPLPARPTPPLWHGDEQKMMGVPQDAGRHLLPARQEPGERKQQSVRLRLRLARLPPEPEGAGDEWRRRVGFKRSLPAADRGRGVGSEPVSQSAEVSPSGTVCALIFSPSVLLIFGGLPGVGKSTVAAGLAREIDAVASADRFD